MENTKSRSSQTKRVTWLTLQKQLLEQNYVENHEEDSISIERDKKDHEKYLKWLSVFLKKEVTYGGSANKVAKKLPDALLEIYRISPQLLYETLKACYRAASYDSANDNGKKYRERVTKFKKHIDSQLSAIKKLCKTWEQYPDITDRVIVQAYLKFRRKYQTDNNKGTLAYAAKPLTYGPFLHALLEEFALVLKSGRVIGKMDHKFPYEFLVGPLRYPKTQRGKRFKPDAGINGLVFHLTMLFRWATARRKTSLVPLKTGSHMPREGKPHYPFVAVLAEATFGRQFSESQVRDRIRELTTACVKWSGWPLH